METLPPDLRRLLQTFLPGNHSDRECPSRPAAYNHTGPWCARCGGRAARPFRYPLYVQSLAGRGAKFLKRCSRCQTFMFLRDAFCVKCGEYLRFESI